MRRKKIRTFKDLRPGDEVLMITITGHLLKHEYRLTEVQWVSKKNDIRTDIKVEEYVVTANLNGVSTTIAVPSHTHPTTVWSDIREGINSQWANLNVLKSQMTIEEIIEVTQGLIEIDNEVEKKNLW